MPFIERPFYTVLVRVVLPPLLGALGAMLATVAPAMHDAMCAPSVVVIEGAA